MQRAHKIRIYPTREQEVQLYKTAGTSRYVYNWALDQWKSMYDAFDKALTISFTSSEVRVLPLAKSLLGYSLPG